MGCQYVNIKGHDAIVCSRGPRRVKPCAVPLCGKPSVALCDYPVERKGRAGTCDSPMCETHRHPVPGQPDTDWCPAHQTEVRP